MTRPFEEYLAPRRDLDNIDRYYVRSSILNALLQSRHLLAGTLLDIGCGRMPYKEILLKPQGSTEKYIGLDLDVPATEFYAKAAPDLLWDGRTIPLAEESVDSVMLTEVLEHCFEPGVVLREARRVLRPGGYVFITVPFLWPLHDVPYDEYRYTPFSLEKHLAQAGFTNTSVKALGGWNASLGQMLSLWLNRSGLPDRKRKWLYRLLLKRAIGWLYEHDHKPQDFLDNSYMLTGITALAQKS
jgi:SAM-dependent methyltransferase